MTYSRVVCGFGLALVVGAGSALAQAPAARPIAPAVVSEGSLSFDGRATLGDFTGLTQTVTGEIMAAASLATVSGWVEAPVKTLLTGNDKRDRDLNKSMESDKYPMIRFDLARVTPGAAVGDTVAVTLHGTFHIHGVDREVELPAQVVFAPGAVQLFSDFPLNLKDYRIGGLSKFLGMFKMSEKIVVHVAVVFRFVPPTVPPPSPRP